jgi:hypothetical protein
MLTVRIRNQLKINNIPYLSRFFGHYLYLLTPNWGIEGLKDKINKLK